MSGIMAGGTYFTGYFVYAPSEGHMVWPVVAFEDMLRIANGHKMTVHSTIHGHVFVAYPGQDLQDLCDLYEYRTGNKARLTE